MEWPKTFRDSLSACENVSEYLALHSLSSCQSHTICSTAARTGMLAQLLSRLLNLYLYYISFARLQCGETRCLSHLPESGWISNITFSSRVISAELDWNPDPMLNNGTRYRVVWRNALNETFTALQGPQVGNNTPLCTDDRQTVIKLMCS